MLALTIFQNYEIKKKNKPQDFLEITDSEKEILKEIMNRKLTMTSMSNLTFTLLACKQLIETNVIGDFLEVGVWRGGHLAAASPFSSSEQDRQVIGIDTFRGMTMPNKDEFNIRTKKSAVVRHNELLGGKGWKPRSLKEVEIGLSFLNSKFHSRLQLFEMDIALDSLPSQLSGDRQISFLRLDVDWYEPTLKSLQHFWDRIPSGGIVVIDDWGSWSGAREATINFLESQNVNPIILPIDTSSYFFVKP